MSFRTRTLLTLLALAPLLESSVRGEALPAGVLARLGTTRFRVGDAGRCLALSPDGKVLASGGCSSVRFWNRASGEQLRAVHMPVINVFKITFSADGKYFAALGDNMNRISLPPGDTIDNAVFVGEVANGKILHRFRGRHTSVVFSVDGKSFLTGASVSGAKEYSIQVWDLASGKEQHKFADVRSYALSPDGKILAGGKKEGGVLLWDVKSGTEKRHMQGHTSPVQALAFSPDGRTLISASADTDRELFPAEPDEEAKPDNSVRLWDVATGKERLPPRRHSQKIQSLSFAPDGKTFISADERRNLYLWDTRTGQLRQRFPGDSLYGNFFLYSPDGKYLLYCGQPLTLHGKEEIYQWDIAAGKETRHWEAPERESSQYVFSADGTTLFSLGASICLWDFATTEERRAGPDHRAAIGKLTFAAGGKSLATLDAKHRLRVWDVARGQAIPSLDREEILRCAFTPEGRALLTVAEDATVSVADLASGRVVRRFRVGTRESLRFRAGLAPDSIFDPDWSEEPHDGCVFDRERRLLAVVGGDECIHLWDVRRGEELHRLQGHRGSISDLRFLPDGQGLFSCGEDNTIRWWDVGKGREVQRYQEDGANPLHYALSPDGRLLAWVGEEAIHLWDLAARKEVRSLKGHAGGTSQVLFERDGGVVVSSGADGVIRCWDTKTGLELRTIAPGKQARPDSLLFAAPDGSVWARATLDGKNSQYALYHVATGREICRLLTYSAEQFALASDGKTIVVSGDKLVFREAASGGIVAEVPAHQRGSITCLAFSPDGKVLASGGADTTVLLWDWRRLTGLTGEDAAKVGDKEIETGWTDLASPEARKAYRAIGALIAGGDKAVSLIRQRLRPVTAADRDVWRKWLADLDDGDFAVREKASQELTQLGVEACFFLRRASAEKAPLEMRRRLEQIRTSAEMKRPSGASLRTIRSVQVLEAIGTPAARDVLVQWSRGDAEAWLTQEAKSALRRLRR